MNYNKPEVIKSQDANVAIAYHNDPGPTAQFVIVPKTASVISVKFKFV